MQQYSKGNQELILKQRPDATDCKPFRQWTKEGRAVMKGEKGIRIWAPRTKKDKADVKYDTDRMLLAALGEGEVELRKLGFIQVSVFDISQTEPIEAFQQRQEARKAAKQAKA